MAEAALSERAVYSARPTVEVDETLHRRLNELLIGMEMREREGGLSALELRLSNVASDPDGGADLAFEDERIVRLGSSITVYGGDENAPQEIFRGLVTGIEVEFGQEDPPEVLVLAEDACQRARMARRTVIHEEVSIADLAEHLASELGLTPRVSGFDAPVGTWLQLNESDLQFLRRLLCRHDGDLQVIGEELHVMPRSEIQRSSVELELYGQLRRARVVADLACQSTEVSVSGWDAAQGERVRATATGTHLGPGRGRSGADILREALGDRREHVGHLAVSGDAEAQALADAAFDRQARRFVCVEGRAEGNPAIRVGSELSLSGLSSRFDNTYYVVSACHRYDTDAGYETDFEAECAYLGEA